MHPWTVYTWSILLHSLILHNLGDVWQVLAHHQCPRNSGMPREGDLRDDTAGFAFCWPVSVPLNTAGFGFPVHCASCFCLHMEAGQLVLLTVWLVIPDSPLRSTQPSALLTPELLTPVSIPPPTGGPSLATETQFLFGPSALTSPLILGRPTSGG